MTKMNERRSHRAEARRAELVATLGNAGIAVADEVVENGAVELVDASEVVKAEVVEVQKVVKTRLRPFFGRPVASFLGERDIDPRHAGLVNM